VDGCREVLRGGAKLATLVDNVVIEEHFLKPSAEYPDGSYMRKVGGEVEIATGFYSLKYPDKPSLYFHKGTPYFFFDLPSRIHTPEPETEKA
jgi:hypothetical protein